MPSECLPGTGAFGFTINMYGEGLYPNNARERGELLRDSALRWRLVFDGGFFV